MGLRVCELFAGVGGFRLGLRAAGHDIIWWNQWEPSTKRRQHAHECYARRFHDIVGPLNPLHNTNINDVASNDIPDHDLLVGGFPCQDFSVAAPLRHSRGLRGNRGALWWDIYRILRAKRPPYLLLENVDRLLTSPKNVRGRDFSVLLAGLTRLRYAAEWRTINAADYSHPQSRRRVFIFGAQLHTAAGRRMESAAGRVDYLTRRGFFASEFKVVQEPAVPSNSEPPQGSVGQNPFSLLRRRKFMRYRNAGVVVRGSVWTRQVEARTESPQPRLRSVLSRTVPEEYYVPRGDIKRWKIAKGAKSIWKTSRHGHRYLYQEGNIGFPDEVTEPARTLLTGEGGLTPSRAKHVIRDPWHDGAQPRYRVLTPEECERLMGFPTGHTEDLPKRWRYFTMGNAVIVPIVHRIGERITEFIQSGERTDSKTASEVELAVSPRLSSAD